MKIKIEFEDVDNLTDGDLISKQDDLFDMIEKKLGKDKKLLPYLLEVERELNSREESND